VRQEEGGVSVPCNVDSSTTIGTPGLQKIGKVRKSARKFKLERWTIATIKKHMRL
jgi:hypothetical protein